MKIPRDVSGEHLAQVLCKEWQYTQVNQVGSHIILETDIPSHQRLAIPAQNALRVGTFNSILRAVSAIGTFLVKQSSLLFKLGLLPGVESKAA
jgi:predicted RNA binding protein YcfA (HicA-like mRNA interferase family)